MDELTEAIGKLKNEKTGGASGILPYMVKAAYHEINFLGSSANNMGEG